ncbi:MAG: PBS lyase [Planctomycetota bacterium]|nr:MAG: PBS lyase [Planctomycetota bacterium]
MHIPRQFFRVVSILAFTVAAMIPTVHAYDGPEVSPEKEQELLLVLRSDGPSADKAIACKNLAIFGSSAAVADLAKLLPNAELSSWARIALEAIPGAEADAALRSAVDSLEGKLLVGTINSIGVRRDANAVDALAPRLQHADAEVASATAVALGSIGNTAAADLLRKSLAAAPANVRSAIAEGCVLCAERLMAEGKSAEAVAIYDEVRTAQVPMQRNVEATRGAILARGQAGIPLLLEQFQSPEKQLFQLALTTAREFPGSEIDQALVEELERATPERAALIVQAMADRPETVVLAAVLKAAEQGPQVVRLSAVAALGRVGDSSCLDSLLKIALDPDVDLSQTAKMTLAEVPGEKIDTQILVLLASAKGKSYPLLLQLVGQRRIDAVPELLKAIDHSDKDVRSAALIALGETVRLQKLPVLISQVVSPKHPEDAPIALQALKAASIRMPDREACAGELATAIERTKVVPTKISLLQILGAMGGTKALAAIGAAAKSSDAQLQDSSSRLLGEWMTEDAAPVLLDLAKIPTNPYNIRALRGYIRIARQFVLPEEQRAEMCQKAFDAASQTAEKKLVLDVLKRYPNPDTLKQAIKAMQIPELKDDATQATLVIAQKLGGKGVDVKSMLATAGLDKVKLEIIKAEYGSGATQKDVTEVVKKQVGDLPLITLVSASYNASFGGDPLPGSTKQLKIKYRINGKAGESTFAEDALIVLPMPK